MNQCLLFVRVHLACLGLITDLAEGTLAGSRGDIVTSTAADWEGRTDWVTVTTGTGETGLVPSSSVKIKK